MIDGAFYTYAITSPYRMLSALQSVYVPLVVYAQDVYGNTVPVAAPSISVSWVSIGGVGNCNTMSITTGGTTSSVTTGTKAMTCTAGVCSFNAANTGSYGVCRFTVTNYAGTYVPVVWYTNALMTPCPSTYMTTQHYGPSQTVNTLTGGFTNYGGGALIYSNPGDVVNVASESFTVMFWINPLVVNTQNYMFSIGVTPAGTNTYMCYWLDKSNCLTLSFGGTNSLTVCPPYVSISLYTWTALAFQYDVFYQIMSIWQDGYMVGSASAAPFTGRGPVVIAGCPAYVAPAYGTNAYLMYDEFVMYQRVVTPGEIWSYHVNSLLPDEDDLIIW